MNDELDAGSGGPGDAGRKRRRRRRRRKAGEDGPEGAATTDQNGGEGEWNDQVLLSGDDGDEAPITAAPRRPRRQTVDMPGPHVAVPASGRNPFRKRSTRPRRGLPSSTAARRRRLDPLEVEGIADWVGRLNPVLVEDLYSALGGQPGRVGDGDRIQQLVVRAIAQGDRVGNLARGLPERERKTMAALLQCGGLAHAEELIRELGLSLGGNERDWRRALVSLAQRGVVVATPEADGQFFAVIPEPLVDGLLGALREELVLPTFEHPEMRLIEVREFIPPLDFSITTLATYMDQHSPRLTQRHDVYRHDLEEMDRFFAQIWEPDSELFSFHLDFLRMLGMVVLRGEYMALDRDALEEWLQLEAEDQRDLVFRALDKRFEQAEWVLWAIHEATRDAPAGQKWIAERPLVTLYRRWRRGEDWRERFRRGVTAASRTNERESWSFTTLTRCGLLELGQWGQEKFYRLSPRARQLLEPANDDGFRQFYLTPSFEIMAPAGLAPILLFRIGELAELIGCDRANTYRITESSIERALERGWRRDDVLQFLRDNSQIGLPDNVEQTLKGWIGHRGDVEFHDVLLMAVHRTQIRRVESNRWLKPYVLHRFAPGLYAIDRARRDEVMTALREAGIHANKDARAYPGQPSQVGARANLQRMVTEARAAVNDGASQGASLAPPEILGPVPGTRADLATPEPEPLPQVTVAEARVLIERAMSKSMDVEMLYVLRTGQRVTLQVQPQRMAYKAEAPVLVALDHGDGETKSLSIERIERLRIVAAS